MGTRGKAGEFNFSDQQVEEFKEVFHEFDMDGDGTISIQELGTVLARVGERMTEKELLAMVAEVDDDNSGAIDFDEFLSMMGKRANDQEKIQKVFNVFDKNQDGYISSVELGKVMADLGERLSEEEVEEMMRWADKDGDGKVGLKEFSSMMPASVKETHQK